MKQKAAKFAKASITKSRDKGRLSLHPLSLEAALSAAMQAGGPPDRKPKKAVGKSRQSSRS